MTLRHRNTLTEDVLTLAVRADLAGKSGVAERLYFLGGMMLEFADLPPIETINKVVALKGFDFASKHMLG